MTIEDHINRDWKCPDCGKDRMTSKEFRVHGIEEHPDDNPFDNLFPSYYVCRVDDESSERVDVYMKAKTEDGPYYMVRENEDVVEEMHKWELFRHEWEWVAREDTPFTKFE